MKTLLVAIAMIVIALIAGNGFSNHWVGNLFCGFMIEMTAIALLLPVFFEVDKAIETTKENKAAKAKKAAKKSQLLAMLDARRAAKPLAKGA